MLNELTISELVAKLARREVSARAATQACLDRIQRVDGQIRAFISYDAADALAQADAADQALAAGQTHAQRPLLGVPIGIKDVIAVKGQPLNCGSKILKDFISPYDATVIEKLKAAGAVVFGRLNMDEFAMGSSTENSAFQVTRNPWDTSRIPGGSSGGSAAAVAADECVAALGSDTGGSIRQPAALCGCVGLKPSYGRVSRYGLVAYASSLDQIGCFAKDVRDAATVLGVIGGHDPRDSSSVPQPVASYAAALTGDIKGLKLGLAKEYMIGGLDPQVKQAVEAAVQQFTKLGAEVVEVSLPHTDYAIATYYIIATAEASANLARFDGIRYGLRVDGADPIETVRQDAGPGFRRRSEAADHPGHLRAEQRLLRRLLPAGAEGAHADPQRLPEGVREGGRDSDADLTHRRFQGRGEVGGPVADVSDGYLHHLVQPGGHLRHQRSLRLHRAGAPPAHWLAASRQTVRGGGHPAPGPRLRAEHRVAQREAADQQLV